MKYALILPDGAADEPIADLDGQTPLEAANTPNIDWISTEGRQGTVVTVPDGYTPGSDVATLSVVGYDPAKYYTGRAPLEAAARKLKVGPNDLIYRCNLVTLVDGCMEDFTAGHIRQEEADRIIEDLNQELGDDQVTFYAGVQYRHLMVLKDAADTRVTATPPHDIPGKPVDGYLPKGKGKEVIRQLMERSQELLAEHAVNQVRRDLGESPATSIWLWGQGKTPALERFERKYGVRGTAITAVDLIRGISVCLGWPLIEVAGATGFIDTNYRGKGQAGVDALDDFDLVMIHIEAPDEAGHMGDAAEKIKSIERIDEHVVGPMLEKLRSFDDWKVLLLPDHPTPVEKRTHTSDPPPFCMAGKDVTSVLRRPFSEANGRASDLHVDPGHELMEYFLKR